MVKRSNDKGRQQMCTPPPPLSQNNSTRVPVVIMNPPPNLTFPDPGDMTSVTFDPSTPYSPVPPRSGYDPSHSIDLDLLYCSECTSTTAVLMSHTSVQHHQPARTTLHERSASSVSACALPCIAFMRSLAWKPAAALTCSITIGEI